MRSRIGVLMLACLSCGAPPTSPDAGPPEVFVAFASDFAPFRHWPWFHRDALGDGGVDALTAGPLTEYLSKRPPSHSTEFPIGTMIVKVIEETSPPLILGMAKRAHGYNVHGAIGWEWFELSENDAGVVDITWRGPGAPLKGIYSNDPLGCNRCHLPGLGNDSVKSEVLQLSGF